jgi:uncharacterized RDD family membrane protein YckC
MSDSPTSANPYESPSTVDPAPVKSYVVQLTPGSNTILPRYLAASADLIAVFVLSVMAFKLLPEDAPLLQCTAVIAIWFGYYFLSEWLISATPAKWLAGLTVKTVGGDRIGPRHAGIRTLLRIVEVNPFIVGAIPAAICILVTERRQRIGDKLAGTVVVRRKRSR